MHQSHNFVGTMLKALILCLYLFRCFVLFRFIVPGHDSDMNNSRHFLILFAFMSLDVPTILQMSCYRFANTRNNTTIINAFNSDNNNIANIKTDHNHQTIIVRLSNCQTITIITNRILKFKLRIKNWTVTKNTFFTVIAILILSLK